MKKFIRITSIITLAIFIIVIGTIHLVSYFNIYVKVHEFSVENYRFYIDLQETNIKNLDSSIVEVLNKKYGCVDTAQTAKNLAEEVWEDAYATIFDECNPEKPFIVAYDSEDKVWLVTTKYKRNYLGGAYYLLIEQEKGEILALWVAK